MEARQGFLAFAEMGTAEVEEAQENEEEDMLTFLRKEWHQLALRSGHFEVLFGALDERMKRMEIGFLNELASRDSEIDGLKQTVAWLTEDNKL